MPLTFLRLNVNDDYNNGMGDVDIADQLRVFYRFDRWMRKFKWWHSIFWWGFGVQMVNAYVCYKTYILSLGIKPVSHYNFQKEIGDAWIQGEEPNDIVEDVIPTGDESVASSITMLSDALSCPVASVVKRPRFCDHNMEPLTGGYRRRLNNVLCHHPVPPTKNDYCKLHYWVTKKKKQGQMITCEECNVTLCAGYCWKVFHTVWDLPKDRENIKKHFKSEERNRKRSKYDP